MGWAVTLFLLQIPEKCFVHKYIICQGIFGRYRHEYVKTLTHKLSRRVVGRVYIRIL